MPFQFWQKQAHWLPWLIRLEMSYWSTVNQVVIIRCKYTAWLTPVTQNELIMSWYWLKLLITNSLFIYQQGSWASFVTISFNLFLLFHIGSQERENKHCSSSHLTCGRHWLPLFLFCEILFFGFIVPSKLLYTYCCIGWTISLTFCVDGEAKSSFT